MRKQRSGRFDYSHNPPMFEPPELQREIQRVGVVTLNGQEIQQVWFADTKAGVLKTYDVFRDGKPHPAEEVMQAGFVYEGDLRDIDLRKGKAASETLRGKVQLWGPDLSDGHQ